MARDGNVEEPRGAAIAGVHDATHGRGSMPLPSLRLCLFTTFLLVPASAFAEPLTATVLDADTMQPIAGATLSIRERVLVTDAAGRVLVGDVAGPIDVTASAPGYETITDTLSPDAPPIVLLFKPGAGGERIEIVEHVTRPTAASSTLITRDEIRALPGGGGDALAAVRSMPGVGQAPPTTGGRLVIRGSAPEDTRLTVDGISVPFLYHAFNNTTIIPVGSVAGIDYTAGGFGVEEGRATGGVVALTTDDTLPTRPTGSASLSVLEVAAAAAAPLGKRVAVAGALRRSTVDLLAPYAVPEDVMVGFTTAPRFYDGQLRLDVRPNDRDKLAVLALLSSDALGVVNHDPDSELPSAFSTETRFARLIASWKRSGERFDNRLVAAVGADRWHAEIGLDQNVDGESRTLQLRDDLRVELADRIQLRTGVSAELAHVSINALAILPPSEGLPPGRIDQLPIKMIDATYDPNYVAAYAATDIAITPRTTLTPGVRTEHFAHLAETRVLPRLQARHRSGPATLTAAIGRYARDLDQAEGISRTLDPELATHATLGAALEVAPGITASLAAFYTHRDDLVVEDAALIAADELPYRTGGVGSSNGFEALVRAQRGRFFGWLAYTFSRSTRRDAPDTIGRPFAYDQTHLFSAVGSYEHGPWRFGARWQLASGLPYTAITGATWSDDLDAYLPMFGRPFAERHDTVHQLDLRIERTWQRATYRIAVFADLGNVYRRARVLRYQYSNDFMSKKPVSDMIPLPSIGVRGEF